MWIELGNINAKLIRYTPEEKKFVHGYLTYKSRKFVRDGARAKYAGEDKHYLYDIEDDTFPAGFVDMLRRKSKELGFTFEVNDVRTRPVERDDSADLGWLRDYQAAAVDAVEDGVRGILHLPTGAGKTEVAVGVMRAFPCRWLFVVHRKGLAVQAAERLRKRAEEHGIPTDVGVLGDGRHELGHAITFATFQTLAANQMNLQVRAHLRTIEGVIIDECHTLAADSFWRVCNRLTNAYYRIGMSGTPLARGDKRSMIIVGALGRTIYRIRPEKLIDAGVLAKPVIRMIPVQHEPCGAETYQKVYRKQIVGSKARNKAIIQAVSLAEKPCLVFVKELRHGKSVVKALQKRGYNVDFVQGNDPTAKRQGLIKQLVRGDLEVLVCTVIFQEGTDIPELRSVVIGSGGKSTIAAVQRVGRGMRVVEGKDGFTVFDILDRGEPMLDRHAKERMRAYASEGYQVVIEATTLPLPIGE